ncbi:MBL fold metallo-hydrolase [Deinococcus peraridilitoris]|uniref:Zn-dependent hydrolase, glyoxylase n=1 Tax=Deinococcus peraridilitoris (strain DSM 19664 / LMG 22246 / CIP 109416 / KR-200) TaxID=937777 RepID=L0A7C9_DEIPD|nr:MBL fold metallo-hydrolase [Deinococcus peraridilitoris]AFZ69716.1 Zn-dependent hydrolase, glyoxylase [Deinococcus peraridilitoris DSM 19664]
MFLRTYPHHDPIGISYLFGCVGKGQAAVIDPIHPPQHYLQQAAGLGVTIKYVIDTHLHADHRSTARDLAAACGAQYVLHQSATTSFTFHAVRDGSILELGNVTVQTWHTPGHTPEHLTLLVTDYTRAPEPWLAFTGHTLMVGDLGRTELASDPESGARALYHSAQRLKTLPDYVQIYPGAFSGSVCGRKLSGNPISTIGFERRHNQALSIDNEDAFVRLMLQDIPPRPANFERVRAHYSGLTVVS